MRFLRFLVITSKILSNFHSDVRFSRIGHQDPDFPESGFRRSGFPRIRILRFLRTCDPILRFSDLSPRFAELRNYAVFRVLAQTWVNPSKSGKLPKLSFSLLFLKISQNFLDSQNPHRFPKSVSRSQIAQIFQIILDRH